MKRSVAGIAALLFWLLCQVSLLAIPPEVEKARQFGAEGQVTLYVVDSHGRPVEKANVSVGFYNPHRGNPVSEGQTDANGCFVAAGTSVEDMHYAITKDAYYKTGGTYAFDRPGTEALIRDGRWQPWNPTYEVVLKEHRNPVPMYAKKIDIRIPVQGKAVGFDLEKGDWVAPDGQGIRADLVLEYTATYEGPQVFSKRMAITFTNPEDGVCSCTLDRTSQFVSVYTAPNGGYAPTLIEECDTDAN